MEIATSTDQWWWSLVHTSSDADRRPADRRRARAGRSQSTPAQNRRRYASRGIRSRRPKSSARLCRGIPCDTACFVAVSYTHLRAHETVLDLVCRLLLEKKKK